MTTTNTPTRSVFLALLVMTGFALRWPCPSQCTRQIPARQRRKPRTKTRRRTMTKTESGLKYLDIKEGTGEPPTKGHTCVVHYTGWLWVNDAKGEKFDSSVDRGVPFSFHVGEAK